MAVFVAQLLGPAPRHPGGGRLRAAKGRGRQGRSRVPGPRGAAAQLARSLRRCCSRRPRSPANALRWNLSELRRLLGGPETVGSGATVGLRLPSGSTLDVSRPAGRDLGCRRRAAQYSGPGAVGGDQRRGQPGFDAWLLGERRRLQGLGGAVLREGGVAGAGRRRHARCGGARYAPARRRSAERGRARPVRPSVRGHGRRGRRRATAGGIRRPVPTGVRDRHRARALWRGPHGDAGRGDRRRSRRRRGAPGVRRGGNRGRCLRPRARRAP